MIPFTCARLAAVAGLFTGGIALAASSPGTTGQLRINQPFASEFPPALLAEGVTSGFVRAVVHVGADDRLLDYLVLACSHRELLAEFQAGIRDWEFVAPRARGEPVPTRTEVVFNFEAHGVVLSLSAHTAAGVVTRWIPRETIRLAATSRELDGPPVPRATVAPVHPGPHLRPPQTQGTATVDFFIDAEGRPRMPVVVSATHDAFGDSATAAVLHWRFHPPTRNGQPTTARVRQTFLFDLPARENPGTD